MLPVLISCKSQKVFMCPVQDFSVAIACSRDPRVGTGMHTGSWSFLLFSFNPRHRHVIRGTIRSEAIAT